MLPTPSTSHVSFDRIYEPAEDSYLLLDTLSSHSEIDFLKARFGALLENDILVERGDGSPEDDPSRGGLPTIRIPCPLILEVGTGSGVVLAFVAAQAKIIFGRTDVLTLGTDINRFACQATHETVIAALNEREKQTGDDRSRRHAKSQMTDATFLGPLLADLTSPVRAGTVDILVFNPPYVPTERLPEPPRDRGALSVQAADDGRSLEEDSYLLSLSYAGGSDGMEITGRLLQQIPDVLSWPRGVAYIVLCAQNRPAAVKERIRAWPGHWCADTVGHTGRKGGWEKLQVIRIWRDVEGSTGQTSNEG